MSQSGVQVASECNTAFGEMKLKKSHKFIIFKLSDNNSEIIIEETSSDPSWDVFRQKLLDAKHVTKLGEGPGPRYAVYDLSYSLEGEGERSKLIMIAWSPDLANVKAKMVYASSKDALKKALNGVAHEIQANDGDDIEYESVLKVVKSRGK